MAAGEDAYAEITDRAEDWDVVTSEEPYRGRIFSLRSDAVRMPDGAVARRDYLEHPGAVAILPMDGEGRVLLVRQYRHPVRQRLWELPAGLLDVAGENPLHAAQRELWEETHHKAGDWKVLVDFYTTPGCVSEAMRIYLARDLAEAEGERFEADGEELEIETAWVPLDVLVGKVLAGEVHNPALVQGVLAAEVARGRAGGFGALRGAGAEWPARPFT